MRALAALLCLPLAASACTSGSCGGKVVQRLTSPDGKTDAILYELDCGATTDFSTQIALLPAGSDPEAPANLFIADTGNGAAAASWGGPDARIQWLSSEHLLIRHDPRARIFRRGSAIGQVRVTYQPLAAGKTQ